ncbi:MAG: DUF4845 domain-containing protein [Gammaproteobacteria bacterium]
MRSTRRQRGLSFISFAFVVIVVAFLGLIGLKLSPTYLEFYKVHKIFADVTNDPGVAKLSKGEIWKKFSKRFNIDSVKSVKKENLKVQKQKGGKSINLRYEVRQKLVGNLDGVVVFDRTVVVK